MRRSQTPDTWTRSEVAEMCDLTREGLRQWEREGLCAPSVRKSTEFGATTPNLYGPQDVARARFVAAARRLGVARSALVQASESVGAYGLSPGWEGWVMVTPQVTTLVPATAPINDQLAAHRDRNALLVWVEMPAPDRELAAA